MLVTILLEVVVKQLPLQTMNYVVHYADKQLVALHSHFNHQQRNVGQKLHVVHQVQTQHWFLVILVLCNIYLYNHLYNFFHSLI